jgi:UDP-arabinose 4-epimerase
MPRSARQSLHHTHPKRARTTHLQAKPKSNKSYEALLTFLACRLYYHSLPVNRAITISLAPRNPTLKSPTDLVRRCAAQTSKPKGFGVTNVLVTGGAGYIGSHTSKLLVRSGFTPIVLDNLSTGSREAVKYGPFFEGDLCDVGLIRKLLEDFHIEAVIHFAANAYVGESIAHPGKYFRNNFVHTLNLVDAMLAAEVDKIIFSSSCATYGVPEALPIKEEHPQVPINPYGESKLMVERLLRYYEHAHGLRWVALRYFNAAGADLDGELGEHHTPETHVLPLVIQTALGQRSHFEIFGTDYPTRDGTAIRDFIHVMDLANAHICALQSLLDGGPSMRLNLGTGLGHSVREVIRMVERITCTPVPLVERPRRTGDPPELIADATRASHILNWSPRYPDLRVMVDSACRWFSMPNQIRDASALARCGTVLPMAASC